MSEDNKYRGAPPDDFSKTTPNIKVPQADEPANDWDKTNYNFPKQPVADDWGKTVTSIKPLNTDQPDFGKTQTPGARQPGASDWEQPAKNEGYAPLPDDFGGTPQDKTMPYFRLPEAERAKYQQLPPTAAEQQAEVEREQKDKGGIPGWFWVAAGLFSMFLFTIAVLSCRVFLCPAAVEL